MSSLVSVIMTAYNSEKFIAEAIESILNQTYQDIELIIVEDVSTDNTLQIIMQFSDDRIRLLQNEKNSGTLYGMKRAMSVAKGKYIAVLDSDDISLPKRIEKQVNFLETHPDVMLCATKADNIINGRTEKRYYSGATTMNEVCFSLLFANENIVHSTIMFRKNELEKRNIKYDKFGYCHDYYLLLGVAAFGSIYLMDEVLGQYRIHATQKTNVLSEKKRQDEAIQAKICYVRKLTGFSVAEKNVLCRAIKGELKNYRHYKALEIALKHYVKICGLGKESKNVIKNECTRILLQQKNNRDIVLFGMTSNLINKRQLFVLIRKYS